MTRSVPSVVAALGTAFLALAGASSAQADGYPPFYGYSPYLGRPTVYFTPDSDVQQVTAKGQDGFDVRTYYRGGPFWRYDAVAPARAARPARTYRRSAVLRRRG